MTEGATQSLNDVSADPLVGQRINNLLVVNRIGEGSMGVVYRARHITLDRDVAIKLLAPQFASDPEYIERFLHEARAAARLQHNNLISVYDAGSENDRYYIAMEFVDGNNLSCFLQEHISLSESEIIHLGIKIANALSYAHRQGIIHRDIKPENLMLSNEGELKIADLGIAKQIKEGGGCVTMEGMIVGTPFYISPEQIRGSNDVDMRADIYSLGVTLFHLATGEVPYKGETSEEIMSKHLTDDPPPPAKSFNPNLSDGFGRVIARMMAKDPAHRFQAMTEVSTALDEVLHAPSPAITPQPTDKITPPAAAKEVVRMPTQSPAKPPAPPRTEIIPAVSLSRAVFLAGSRVPSPPAGSPSASRLSRSQIAKNNSMKAIRLYQKMQRNLDKSERKS